MARFRRSHPGIDVHFVEDGGPRLFGHIERGAIHLALTAAADERYASRTLFPAVTMAVTARRHPLAKHQRVDVAALATAPLLLLRRDFGTRLWFDAACHTRRVQPVVLLVSRRSYPGRAAVSKAPALAAGAGRFVQTIG